MIETRFNEFDLSAIPEDITLVVQEDTAPIVLSAGATLKGTEKMIALSGSNFTNMYGKPSYKKFGQTSIQNQRLIDAGARILFKRLVADDASLANAVLVAKLYQTSSARLNIEGKPLYITAEGVETTEATTNEVANTPIMDHTAHIMYQIESAVNTKDIAGIKTATAASLNEIGKLETIDEQEVTVFSYPLFIIADNGRGGDSTKRFRLYPEYALSKTMKFMFHTLYIMEDGKTTDVVRFSALPDRIYNNECVDLNSASKANLTQVETLSLDENVIKFIEKLSELSGVEEDVLKNEDFLLGCYRKGSSNPLPSIELNVIDGIDPTIETGVGLANGDNGEFGANPIESAAYKTALHKFYSGELDIDIYNLDKYQVSFAFDSDLPDQVKNDIIELAEFRGDFMFYRDYGKGITSLDDVIDKHETMAESKYVSDFCQTYDVIDPFSLKQTNVTITYSLAPMIINHIARGVEHPFAGQANSAVINEAIAGTVNFEPRKLPAINEKDTMEDLKVNFASYFKDNFVIESLYTAKPGDMTQLSFSNNRQAVQEVIRMLRVKFPAIRYQFITKEEDMKAYQAQINEELNLYRSKFVELRFEYISDKLKLARKIFRGALYFSFNEFAQAEEIDAYMLPTDLLS